MTEREQLFRPEVLLHRPDRNFGTPVFQQNSWSGMFVLLSVIFVAAALLLLVITQYKEAETTRGVLVPIGGSHRVVAPVTAIVRELAVSAGAMVHAGQVLATLERATFDSQGHNVAEQEVVQLQAQRDLLQEQRRLQWRHYKAAREQGIAAMAALDTTLQLIDAEQTLLQQTLQLSEARMAALATLAQARAITRAQRDQAQMEHLEIQLREQAMAQRRQSHVLQSNAQQAQLENLQSEFQQAQLRTEQELQRQQMAISQLVNQSQFAVVAAAEGIVATVAIDAGQSVQALQPLFYINTEPEQLQATLYVSSRVLGKLYPGQEVLLSYDAFDLQHFGRYQATISSIEHASLDPREHLLPVPGIQEPVFRITAQLGQAWVEGSDVFRLQAGMLFSADIVLEEMSLLEFIFKPVLRMWARQA